jgi:hypothetical protein
MRTAQQPAVIDLGSARRPRERQAPRLEAATERAGIEMPRGAILSEVREPDAVESRTNDKVQIVDDEPAVHRNGQRLIASIPAMDLVTAVAEVDAAVCGRSRGPHVHNALLGSPHRTTSATDVRDAA